MTIAWETPVRWPRLRDDEIHVWCVELDEAADAAALAACLSAGERGRAGGLPSSAHRRRFVAARATLRQLLGRYLGQEPGAVVFAHGAHGKPFLPQGGLHFNVSHTQGLALYAIASAREVGVDVEWMRPQVAHERIAARFFALEEREMLAQVPAEERRVAFYHIWTRKEAYLKARGDGLAAGLDTFAVSLEAEALLRSGEGRRWKLVAWEPAVDYVAALCGAGVDWRMRGWRL